MNAPSDFAKRFRVVVDHGIVVDVIERRKQTKENKTLEALPYQPLTRNFRLEVDEKRLVRDFQTWAPLLLKQWKRFASTGLNLSELVWRS